jgi:hypothetical protein
MFHYNPNVAPNLVNLERAWRSRQAPLNHLCQKPLMTFIRCTLITPAYNAYEMAAYKRHAYEIAPVRSTSMRDAPIRDTPVRDAYGMASVRSTPMRNASMRWPSMRDTLMRDASMRWPPMRGTSMRWSCEEYVYERRAYKR